MRRFLIAQFASFGDCLYATTIARQIKHDFPDSHITWAIGSKYSSILLLNPFVDKVWEISVPPGLHYYDESVWGKFEEEAKAGKEKGEYDEFVFSQIPQRNWGRFDGTIRSSILKGYTRPVTVPVDPVIRLSEEEIQHVKKFAETHRLKNFKEVILFECVPGSGQSLVNIDFAVNIAKQMTGANPEICMVLSSPVKSPFVNDTIIDGSVLTYRENAELTKYCSFLIGCSSGITWLCTSAWSKKLPTLQLLNKNSGIYAGLNFDFQIHGLNNSHVIEMVDYNPEKVIACLETVFNSGTELARKKFNQEYKPSVSNLNKVAYYMHFNNESIFSIIRFAYNYKKRNSERDNHLSVSIFIFSFKWLYKKIRFSISMALDKAGRKRMI